MTMDETDRPCCWPGCLLACHRLLPWSSIAASPSSSARMIRGRLLLLLPPSLLFYYLSRLALLHHQTPLPAACPHTYMPHPTPPILLLLLLSPSAASRCWPSGRHHGRPPYTLSSLVSRSSARTPPSLHAPPPNVVLSSSVMSAPHTRASSEEERAGPEGMITGTHQSTATADGPLCLSLPPSLPSPSKAAGRPSEPPRSVGRSSLASQALLLLLPLAQGPSHQHHLKTSNLRLSPSSSSSSPP